MVFLATYYAAAPLRRPVSGFQVSGSTPSPRNLTWTPPARLAFTADNVLGYADQPTTLPAGRTCLKLARRWRHSLGLAVN